MMGVEYVYTAHIRYFVGAACVGNFLYLLLLARVLCRVIRTVSAYILWMGVSYVFKLFVLFMF